MPALSHTNLRAFIKRIMTFSYGEVIESLEYHTLKSFTLRNTIRSNIGTQSYVVSNDLWILVVMSRDSIENV